MQVLKRLGAMVRHFFAHERSPAERDRLNRRLERAFPGNARRRPDSADSDRLLVEARAIGSLRS